MLTLSPESPAIYAQWKRLIIRHNVHGVKVHDTRLVAAMNVHFIRKIQTFNTTDFERFDIEPIPSRLGASAVGWDALWRPTCF